MFPIITKEQFELYSYLHGKINDLITDRADYKHKILYNEKYYQISAYTETELTISDSGIEMYGLDRDCEGCTSDIARISLSIEELTMSNEDFEKHILSLKK